MPSTSLQMLDMALQEAAKQLLHAAGQDEHLSAREFRQKLATLSGEMRDLTEALYLFVVELDHQGANNITETDIEKTIHRVKTEIFPQYAIAEQVLDEAAQQTVQAIAPKTALTLALQLYQTARAPQVLPADQVFQAIQSYTPNLFFDYLGSEASMPLEAVHIPATLTILTQETFAAALGLDSSQPAGMIARFREATTFFPIFVRQHLDFGLDGQAQSVVDVMENNLHQISLVVTGEDSDRFGQAQHPLYAMGLAADGSLVGFKSVVIWT